MNTNFLINFFLNVDKKKKKSINRTISLLILFKVHNIAYLNFCCCCCCKARQICKDATSNCRKYVEVDAQACTNDEFVWHTCPWTCGYCNQVDGNSLRLIKRIHMYTNN